MIISSVTSLLLLLPLHSSSHCARNCVCGSSRLFAPLALCWCALGTVINANNSNNKTNNNNNNNNKLCAFDITLFASLTPQHTRFTTLVYSTLRFFFVASPSPLLYAILLPAAPLSTRLLVGSGYCCWLLPVAMMTTTMMIILLKQY